MRTIHKRPEPQSLTQHRASSHASYDNYSHKEELRAALVAEQRGLCCYCLSRIPGSLGLKIEHWHSQSRYPEEQLSYANLLGVCTGNEGQPFKRQHCDTRKGDQDLSRNPSNPLHSIDRLVRFELDGRIASDNVEFNRELDDVLNLNAAFLRNNRKAKLDAFKAVITRPGDLPRSQLEKWLREWNGESGAGELQEHCQVIVYWLRKRLERA